MTEADQAALIVKNRLPSTYDDSARMRHALGRLSALGRMARDGVRSPHAWSSRRGDPSPQPLAIMRRRSLQTRIMPPSDIITWPVM